MGGKSKSVTVGYRYYVGMHLVWGLSPHTAPMTALKKIRVGEKDAWTGSVTTNTALSINQPDLFGGDKKEGGVVGTFDIEFGSDTQAANSYLAAKMPGLLPAFRGVAGMVLRSPQMSALNPYIKPVSAYWERINGGFYPAKSAVAGSMNPAHILYELMTRYEFGIGLAPSDLDLASFTAAADTLYAEGFGLSFFWEQDEPTDDFIQRILEHIGGVRYFDPATGLIALALARNDFVLSSLPVLDASNILRVDRFAQPLPGELVSEVQVRYEDQATGEPASVTVQDIAILELQGNASVPAVLNYEGIPSADLAAKVALRELRERATPLARAEIVCNRDVWDFRVGQPFRFQYPRLGVDDMVMRVVDINTGTLVDGRITISAVQDVFRAADTQIGTPPASSWVTPVSAPAAAPVRLAMEAPYWVVARDLLGDQDVLLDAVDPDAGILLAAGSRPSGDAYDYRLLTRTGAAAYTDRAAGAFMPTAVLAAPVGRTDTAFSISTEVDIDLVQPDTWAHIDGELVKVIAVSTGSLTCKRGVLDTVPAPHSAGVAIHFADDFNALDPTEWSTGQTINAKLLTRTGLGTLLEASAPADSATLASRFSRPYPPGNVQINGSAYPASVSGNLSITWAHRDRTLQTAYLVEQTEASIGPEPGTTYTVRIYNAQSGGTLIRTYSGIAGTSQAYTTAQAATDNGGSQPANIRIEIDAVRGSYTSWQSQRVPCAWV